MTGRAHSFVSDDLLRDRVLWITLGALLIATLPYFLPLDPDVRVEYGATYLPSLKLLAVLVAVCWGLRKLTGPQRMFWNLAAAAFAVWLTNRLLFDFDPNLIAGALGDVLSDALYLVFYVLLLSTGLIRLCGDEHRQLSVLRRYTLACLSAFGVGLLVYLVIVPSVVRPQSYGTFVPSIGMYLVLDLLLCGQFVYRSLRDPCAAHRRTYRWIAAAVVAWSIGDLLEILELAGRVGFTLGSPLDLIWWIPYPLFVVAARSRSTASSRTTMARTAQGFETHERYLSGTGGVMALLLPAAHLVGYGFQLFDPALRQVRDVVTLTSVVVFAVILFRQQRYNDKMRRHLDDELRATTGRLYESQKMEALGRLAGGVAHDFNNLLTAIYGNVDLLRGALGRSEPAQRYVLQISAAAQRAGALVRQLLAFSRRRATEPETLELNAVVMELLTLLRRVIGENIQIVTDLDPDVGHVRVDRAQLEQVILNLAVNASDAMRSGGTLTLTTSSVEGTGRPGQATAGTALVRHALLRVHDTGCGMDENLRRQIFEPFFTTKGTGLGTGLGLSIVYGIVRQNHGDVWVESEPGQGTTFYVALPEAARHETPDRIPLEVHVEQPAAASPLPVGAATVLLVEDDPGVRTLAREVLEADGYAVLEAEDGEHAWDVQSNHRGSINLLLSDVVMPRLGGLELAAKMRVARPETRVLLMSGYAPERASPDAPDLLQSLPKPFTADALRSRVRDALRGRSDA